MSRVMSGPLPMSSGQDFSIVLRDGSLHTIPSPEETLARRLDELERRIEIFDNKVEMILNILSGMNIPDIAEKIDEVEK